MKNKNLLFTAIITFGLARVILAQNEQNYICTKTNSRLSFTENKGQIHDQNYNPRPDILFAGGDGNFVFHLKNNGISCQLNKIDTWKEEKDFPQKKTGFENIEGQTKLVADQTTIYRLDLNWLNANINAELIKQNPIEGFNNYYLENCPNGVLNVKSYQQITYQNIYNGIDLKWYQKEGALEYDYIVSAGADYKQIEIEIKGADEITLNNKGELIFKTPLGDIIEQAPLVKQNGKTLKSKWVIKNEILSFEIENINKKEAFVIDPVVRVWGTYYGGSGNELGYSCTTDASGNVYMSGYTASTSGIATTGAHQTVFGGGNDAFLVMFNSSGVRQWGTYYGGSGYDYIYSCATDASGNVYMSGETNSNSGITTTGAHQTVYGGGNWDAYLVKFNSSGARQWGTYYGGSGNDNCHSCATDASGNVYMAGWTDATSGIATVGAHQTVFGGSSDAFLVKFDSAGIRLWGTYYGGSGYDCGYSCTTDAFANVYLAGGTNTSIGTSIASSGSHQFIYAGGGQDAFLVKFNLAGNRQWGTYYGCSSGNDLAYSCATDAFSNIYMTGHTNTLNTNTGNEIATTGAHQTVFGGGMDAYLVKFNSSGVRQWGTYYGGSGYDLGYSCTTDASGNVYMSGNTDATSGIATVGAHQTVFGGSSDAYLVKFNDCGNITITTITSAPSICFGMSTTITASGATTYTWMPGNLTGASITVSPPATTTFTVTGTDVNGCVNTAMTTVTVNPLPTVSATSSAAAVCAGSIVTFTGGGAATYTWDPGNLTGSSVTVTPTATTTYTVTGTNSNACVNTATLTVTVNPLPILFVLASSQVYCSSDVAGTLSANPTGGLWSGPGVTGNSFDPSVAGFGLHNIVYTYTDANSCSNSDTLIMTVNPLPILLVLASSQVYCTTDLVGSLSANPTGGLWTGPGVSGNSFDPSVAGFGLHTVIYTYTDNNSCTNSDSLLMTVNACVGIIDITQNNLFSIYPNPAKNVLNIKADAKLIASAYIVYDNTGKVVLSGKINAENTSIELGNLSAGIYLFSVGENLKQTFKVIKE